MFFELLASGFKSALRPLWFFLDPFRIKLKLVLSMDPTSDNMERLHEEVSELAMRILNLETNPPSTQQEQPSITANETLKRELAESILSSVEEMIERRMEPMIQKVENLGLHCRELEEKLQWLCGHLDEWGLTTPLNYGQERFEVPASTSNEHLQIPSLTSSTELPTSQWDVGEEAPTAGNTEDGEGDYPNGVWLGDPTNPDLRVRMPIVPEDLEMLNETCLDMADMALTLFDLLFDRETMACSNLSGKGKLKKKQLDPIKIEAIRCHLLYKYNISEQDWREVKIKLDAKCKTAFQRKRDGLPMATVKTFKKRSPRTSRKTKEEQPQNPQRPASDEDEDQ